MFPETFVPRTPTGCGASRLGRTSRALRQAPRAGGRGPGPAPNALGARRERAKAYVAIGVNELDGGTLYNTLLYFAPDGSLLGRHRKLMPTGGERLVWGLGDGSTLAVYDTPFGTHRRADLLGELHAAGPRRDVRDRASTSDCAPTWDNGDTWVSTLRHIATRGPRGT